MNNIVLDEGSKIDGEFYINPAVVSMGGVGSTDAGKLRSAIQGVAQKFLEEYHWYIDSRKNKSN